MTPPTDFSAALRAMDDALAAGLWAQAADLSDTLFDHVAEATPAERERAMRLVRRAEQWMRRQQTQVVEQMRAVQHAADDEMTTRGQLVDVRA